MLTADNGSIAPSTAAPRVAATSSSNRSRKRSRFSAPLVPGPFRGPWPTPRRWRAVGGVYNSWMTDSPPPPEALRLLRWIMGAVLVWGTILAIGAWRLNHDPRRLAVVLACVIAFLGFWLAMLASWRRARSR